ncbi:MAG: ABC transporter ATP-binding protein [Kineosporiaceae bacterium]
MLRILRRYGSHLRRYPHHWLPVLVLSPLAAVLVSFVPAYAAAELISRFTDGPVPLDRVWAELGFPITVFVVSLVVGELVLRPLVDVLVWSLEAKMVERLYADCFRHLSGQPATFFADRFVGSMVSAVQKYTGAYVMLADTVTFQALPLLGAVIVTVALTAGDVPWFAAGVVVVVAALVLLTVATFGSVAGHMKRWAETHTAVGGRVADVLGNVLVVKSFAREADEQDDFAGFTGRHRRATTVTMWAVISRNLAIGGVIVALLLIALVSIVVVQASGVDIATLVVVLTFGLALFGYLWELPRITRMCYRAHGDAMPMVDLFDVPPAVTDPEQPEEPRISHGRITLDRVTLRYPDAPAPVFTDLTLEMAPGERLGLVGPSGSGKTSVTRLLLRFVDPQSGAVRIDGQDVRRVTQRALRSRIAFVPQEPLLFHRSIAENIGYGRPGADPAEVVTAARRAQVLEFVDDLPDGLDTVVGEKGVKLSGGQRQRIAIARAILSDAPILVLDEATSALDSLSEARIQEALDEAMAGRTTIAIAHRLSTLRSMTRLVVLDRGRVVEDGPHEDLVSAGGVYARMWQQQSGGFVTV